MKRSRSSSTNSKSFGTRIGGNGVFSKIGVYDGLTTRMTRPVAFKTFTLTAIAERCSCPYDGNAHRLVTSLRALAIDLTPRDLRQPSSLWRYPSRRG
jgi:hypothetical protein